MIKKLDHFVLYLETESHEKYELLKSKPSLMLDIEMEVFDVFRFARVKNPERLDN